MITQILPHIMNMKTIVITDQLETIPLLGNTKYIVNNITNTHIVFSLGGNHKIGDEYSIIGNTGPVKCAWMLEMEDNVSIKFDDVVATKLIQASDTDSLFMHCVSTNPLVFRACTLKGKLILNNTTDIKEQSL